MGTRRRLVAGAALVGALAALWQGALLVVERLAGYGTVGFPRWLGGLLAIGAAGGYLLRSPRALVAIPLAVALATAVLAGWVYLTGPYTESPLALVAVGAGVIYGGAAALGAAVGVLAARAVPRR